MDSRICVKCHRLLPIDNFTFRTKGGLRRRECKDCAKEYRQSNNSQYQERRTKLHSIWLRKKKYNLSDEEFEARRAAQNNRCKLCREEFIKTPHVDHCHETGIVRGLLCGKCNTGLGLFNHDIKLLQLAITYLQEFHANLQSSNSRYNALPPSPCTGRAS